MRSLEEIGGQVATVGLLGSACTQPALVLGKVCWLSFRVSTSESHDLHLVRGLVDLPLPRSLSLVGEIRALGQPSLKSALHSLQLLLPAEHLGEGGATHFRGRREGEGRRKLF